MAFPQTLNELEANNYRFNGHGRCKGCGAAIEWWYTPEGGRMPLDIMLEATTPVTSHFATCPNAAEFRKRKAGAR